MTTERYIRKHAINKNLIEYVYTMINLCTSPYSGFEILDSLISDDINNKNLYAVETGFYYASYTNNVHIMSVVDHTNINVNKFTDCIYHICKHDYIDLFTIIYNKLSKNYLPDCMYVACKYNSFGIVTHLVENNILPTTKDIYAARKNMSHDVLNMFLYNPLINHKLNNIMIILMSSNCKSSFFSHIPKDIIFSILNIMYYS